ncbi:hypothetical protein BJ875DRAFT_201477 [Amylocarpus encephaloides]|uniref:Swi5-dependent recombination DNA repair protein 1 n=1 Tax=Amylocarpus encephaloides TaxID=45428 RepID=A0A9P7YNP5_9HELO|nr:hypothetical protein BJ875DRAFT_201477 [Amylocarpus encephaloides]
MSTPSAKKRRIDDASKTLSKPFRSPFKSFKSAVKAQEGTATPTAKTVLSTVLPDKPPSLNSIPTTPRNLNLNRTPRSSAKKTFSSPVSTAVLNADPAIAPLLRAQRELERELRQLKEELDTAEQARKIEKEKRGEDGEIDGELKVLVTKWRGASRDAAEEMFGRVRDRVNRMGGPRAWKEMQKKQHDFSNQWEQDDQANNNDDDDDEEDNGEEKEKRKNELRSQYDLDPETENEKSQRAKGVGDTGERAGEEDEFTMAMMLRTLNVDLDIIGYDREEQRWFD